MNALRRRVGDEDITPLLVAVLDAIKALRADLASLPTRGPRDAADVELMTTMAESTQGRTFTAADLLHHARVDVALAAALEGADITTARELGKLLSRLAAVSVAGLRLERVGASRAGLLWRVRVCD